MNGAGNPDYFDEQYPDYEKQNPQRKLDHYLDVIDSFLKDEHVSLLDVGCGLGSFLERTHHRHPTWDLFGIDTEPRGVATTKDRVPSASVEQGSAALQGHPDASMHVITAWDVIEHVDSLEDVARAVRRMLRPNGLFAFVVPVYDGVLGSLVRKLDTDPTHLHKKGRGFWLNWASAEFDVLDWHGIFRYLVAGRWYAHVPSRRFRQQASAILVVCGRTPP